MGELGGAVELKCSVRNDTSSHTVEKTVVGLQLKFHKETGQHIVKSVSQNTPAARSELRNGDILVAVNGQSVNSPFCSSHFCSPLHSVIDPCVA
eukprot:1959735-Rhodomonas_salina.1